MANGGVQGKFANVYSLLPGVLKADFRYSPNKVDAFIAAGSLLDLLKGIGGATREALKFAAALDGLRGNDYNKLASVFGSVDVMAGQQLAQNLHGLAPKTDSYVRTAQDRQRATAINLVANRLSMIGRPGASGKLSLTGSPSAMLRLAAGAPARGLAAGAPARGLAERQSFVGMGFASNPRTIGRLPQGMSGFVASGYTLDGGQSNGSRYDGQRSWHLASGLEQEVATGTTLGIATSYGMGNRGIQRSTDWAWDEVAQVALYGSRAFGEAGYVGSLVSALRSTADTGRRFALGEASYSLRSAPAMNSYTHSVESGVNLPLGRSLTVTPRNGVRYALTRTGGYSEAGGDAALRIDGQRFGQAETRLGAKSLGNGWSFEPRLQLDWVQHLSGDAAGLTARFVNAQGIGIDLPGDGRASNWAELRGGFQLSKGALAFVLSADASTARREVGDNQALASDAIRSTSFARALRVRSTPVARRARLRCVIVITIALSTRS